MWACMTLSRVRVMPHQLHVGPAPINHFLQFFEVFKSKKIPEKSKIKSKKISKIHKFMTSFLELLFDSNFFHWMTNFLIFYIIHLKYKFKEELIMNFKYYKVNPIIHSFSFLPPSSSSSPFFFYSSSLKTK